MRSKNNQGFRNMRSECVGIAILLVLLESWVTKLADGFCCVSSLCYAGFVEYLTFFF